MDWLEIPAAALGWLDAQLSAIASPMLRLIIWSAVAGTLTMLLYKLLSPQRRIVAAKAELADAQQRLNRFDGEFAEAWPLMRGMLGSAFKQLGLVSGPAIAALLPMVLLAAWMAQTYGYAFPEQAAPVTVRTAPQQLQAHWIPPETRVDGATNPARVALEDGDGRMVGELEVQAPVPVIGKRTWWAAMAGSPLGFLPDELPVERVELDLPRREFIGWGPSWMRSWEFLFFTVLTVVALGVKRLFHIH